MVKKLDGMRNFDGDFKMSKEFRVKSNGSLFKSQMDQHVYIRRDG